MAVAVRTGLDVVGRDVDDVSASALGHDRRDRTTEEEGALRVRTEDAVEVDVGPLPRIERAGRLHLARVVDQDVDRAVQIDGGVDDTAHVRRIGDVADESGRAEVAGHLRDRRVAIGDDHLTSRIAEARRERATESARGARHDRDLSRQSIHRAPLC
jgi:hypothetical protein